MKSLQVMNEWHVSQWFNTKQSLRVSDLRGRIVLIHAFQMLCPGCVSHGIPQAVRVSEAFPANEVAVIGLHTVFEHHDAMQPHALAAFIHEYRLKFPIGVDSASVDGPIPKTMQQLSLQGTPSLVLLDREGKVRLNHFGFLDDLRLGCVLGQLLAGSGGTQSANVQTSASPSECTDEGCAIERV